VVCLLTATRDADAHGFVRRDDAALPIATGVGVPGDAELLFLGAILPGAADPNAPPGSPERLGDMGAQARSVLGKIEAELAAAGYGMADIVRMDVYLVADPRKGGALDLTGLMAAYLAYFGEDTGGLPPRTTVQVAALPAPGALVQIAVIAARGAGHDHDHD
jgi:enamine deaminase RidA (YjgF/YER057c/UK114 family)